MSIEDRLSSILQQKTSRREIVKKSLAASGAALIGGGSTKFVLAQRQENRNIKYVSDHQVNTPAQSDQSERIVFLNEEQNIKEKKKIAVGIAALGLIQTIGWSILKSGETQ